MRIKCIKNGLKTNRYVRLRRRGSTHGSPIWPDKEPCSLSWSQALRGRPMGCPTACQRPRQVRASSPLQGDDLKGRPILFQLSFHIFKY